MLSEFPANLRLASVLATWVLGVALATPALADGHGDSRKHRMDGDREARERMMQMERDRRRQAGARGQRDDDALAEYLFPPDQIMRHREALNLSDGQGKKLVALMSGFQAGVVETQWKLAEAKTAMKQQLEAERISEKGIRAALDDVLELENTVKRRHILLLVQLRNELTPEQISKLRSMR